MLCKSHNQTEALLFHVGLKKTKTENKTEKKINVSIMWKALALSVFV